MTISLLFSKLNEPLDKVTKQHNLTKHDKHKITCMVCKKKTFIHKIVIVNHNVFDLAFLSFYVATSEVSPETCCTYAQ